MDVEDFRRLFRYDAWANGEVLKALRVVPEPSARTLELLGHLLGAGHNWLARLRHEPPSLAIWLHLKLAAFKEDFGRLGASWQAYLEQLTDEETGSMLAYVNSKGLPFSAPVRDILMHVITHGSYHRGQIAAEMRANGQQPAATDLIVAALTGGLD